MRQVFFHVKLVILMLVLSLVVFACDHGEDASLNQSTRDEFQINEPSSEKKVKIGFSMDTLEEERWLKDRDLFRAAIISLGGDVDILAANGDDALQIFQAEVLISRGVDLLVVAPHNAEAAAAIVNKAHQAGVKVVSYDRLIKNATVDLYISFDNEQVGKMQAEAITKLVPKGNYVYIGGAITDNNAHLLKKGVFTVLQPFINNGDITVVFDSWTKDWNPSNAFINMETALKANNNKIDAVIAANDATAGSVIEALATQGLAGKVPVAGQDADLAAIQRIVEGTQTMTVYKPIKLLAEKAAEISMNLAKGQYEGTNRKISNGKVEIPSVLLLPIAVDRHNFQDTVVADGFHSLESILKYRK